MGVLSRPRPDETRTGGGESPPGGRAQKSATRTSAADAKSLPHPLGVVAAAGMMLGRYELLGRLGSGGMADVWVGRVKAAGDFERLVAVKTVRPEAANDASARAMFLREAELASTIRHTNVVEVFDVGEHQGVLYQVMSLVEGDSLAGLLRRCDAQLSLELVVSVISDALRGLHAAHTSVDARGNVRQLIHRDVSPHNILVGLDGSARLADFGIAKALAHDETTRSVKGKVAYFAPEQVEQGRIDQRTDVFAMGIVLWECLVGRRLFKGSDMIDTLKRVATMAIPDARVANGRVPQPLADVAARALQRRPEGRFESAMAMVEALSSAASAAGVVPSVDATAQFVRAVAGADIKDKLEVALRRASPPSSRPVIEATLLMAPRPKEPSSALAAAPSRAPLPARDAAPWAIAVGAAIAVVLVTGSVGFFLMGRSTPRLGEGAPVVPASAVPTAAPVESGPPSAADPITTPATAASATAASAAPPAPPSRPPPHGKNASAGVKSHTGARSKGSTPKPSAAPAVLPVSSNPFR